MPASFSQDDNAPKACRKGKPESSSFTSFCACVRQIPLRKGRPGGIKGGREARDFRAQLLFWTRALTPAGRFLALRRL